MAELEWEYGYPMFFALVSARFPPFSDDDCDVCRPPFNPLLPSLLPPSSQHTVLSPMT